MRIALISDIHANLASFEAVLADIDQRQIDQIICLGDVATLGQQPREAISRLKALACQCVMGNHDEFLLDPNRVDEVYPDLPWIKEQVEWCLSQLSKSDLDFLRSFRPFIEIKLSHEANLLCFHGSPNSNTAIILAMTSESELDEMLQGHTATVMAGGHTHVQMVRRYKKSMIINVGSVGVPFEQFPFDGEPSILPWAEYAIVDWKNGALSIELRRVPIED